MLRAFHLPLGVTGPAVPEQGDPVRLNPRELGGGPVLVLGSLGLDLGGKEQQGWLRLGRLLRRAGTSIRALVPVPRGRWDDELARVWGAIPWERPVRGREGALDEAERSRRAGRLLALLSPAWRIEPELLRAIRRCLPREEADIGTEIDAWNRGEINISPTAAAFHGARVAAWRSRFFAEPPELQARVWSVLRAWHWNEGLQPEAWHLELLSLDAAARDLKLDEPKFFGPGELERAQRSLIRIARDARTGRHDGPRWRGVQRGWCDFIEEQAPSLMWDAQTASGRALQIVYFRVHRDEPKRRTAIALDLSLRELALDPAQETIRSVEVRQVGASLNRDAPQVGSFVALLATTQSEVKVNRQGDHRRNVDADSPALLRSSEVEPLELATDLMKFHLARATQPAWAVAMGRDRFGLWADLRVEGVVQRMRWIPPGRFVMGSPLGEQGRFDDEGPQHEVILTRGFWMGETPVTQALWQALTGGNPSRFQSPDRPVEKVSWNECDAFIREGLNSHHAADEDGVFRLPTEAEWEYACRAGMQTATYAGDLEILGDNNAPLLDDIAWYGGNSGFDFDLVNGHDSSEWMDKEHDHTRAGTRPVKQKHPNAWGLYDMLGNVWEWCQDGPHSYSKALQDPWGPTAEGELRVLRGGSWFSSAEDVRAACRDSSPPDDRISRQGFRLVRGHVPPAEPRKPAWAVAVGHDRFGLWADLRVEGVVQRMRWIPPGRFVMGSPPGEQGRQEREGPQHEVILTRGFWMGETPVTQALWQALTGDNPSRFQSPDRPVEQVSWEECDAAIRDGLNSHHAADEDGVFRLPTEAEWEYACRAGTKTATYAGEIEILGKANAPILNDIAWYRGNSGVNFDLENGENSSDWPGKQFPHKRAGTRPVREKLPNAWGLYDMLGNVWEWCQDGLRSYGSALQQDPWGSTTDGGRRVHRGGSWRTVAMNVRAAFRSNEDLPSKGRSQGLRLVRGQRQPARTGEDQPEGRERSGSPALGDPGEAPPRAGRHERGRRE